MLSVERVHISFGNRKILDGVSLDIAPGSIEALTGKSGSGKTTLFGVIAGLVRPDGGRVLYRGKNIFGWGDIHRSRYRNREIGYVFQTFNLLPNLTARDNIALPAVLNRRSGKIKKTLDYLVEYLDLEKIIGQYPATLSGGEKQRVAIARSLINSPSLILADEPTGNLDEENGDKILALFREISRERNISVIAATHDSRIISAADGHFHLENGKVERASAGKRKKRG